ncbi:MAG TPA: valine--tRNA ligase, partial [Pseudohaliea sp.]|nr:valine--tRNA ligase [Pseudohaliea sp.]
PLINILNADATLSDAVPAFYRGLDRFTARERVVEDLEKLGFLDKVEDHTLKVPRGDRSGVVIEPWLTPQWYVDAKKLAGPAIEAVESGAIEFVPKQWENTYFAWMRDIQDWCISRQLWWGHRIPAWYDPEGNVYVGEDEAGVRAEHGLDAAVPLHRDEDVLDTWFSSALWTFSTLGWPDDTAELARYHPTSVLVTGFDIIFFWVARMIMMTLHFRGEVPFRTVYVHGLVRDAEGQKMSKSKGNVLDPIDLIDGIELDDLVAKRTAGLMQPRLAAKIEKATRKHFPDGISAYGTDALRFTYYSLASTGRDIKFDLGRIEGYRNFCNKIWNAARYVLMNTEGEDCGQAQEAPVSYHLVDRWIRSRLQDTIGEVHRALGNYRFDLAAQVLYDFVWNEYCDWYLELSKVALRDEAADEAAHRGTRQTLVQVLESVLRLLHPFMPFLTEEIWQAVAPLAGAAGPTIMRQRYPQVDPASVDKAASAELEWLKAIVLGVRNIRGEMNVAPGKTVDVLLRHGTENDKKRLQDNRSFLMQLARLGSVRFLDADEAVPAAATALAGDVEILVPLAGLIDRDAELDRLARELDRIEGELKRLRGKLGNPGFVAKAPADVVEREREKLAAQEQARTRLEAQRQTLENM